MKTVFKYMLQPGPQEIELAEGAVPLCVGLQDGVPSVWALVDNARIKKKRSFFMAGTGHPLPEKFELKYIGTAHSVEGWMVWHLFEIIE